MSSQLPAPAVTTTTTKNPSRFGFGSRHANNVNVDYGANGASDLGDRPTFRDDIYATALEFLGTFVFLLLGLGGVQSAISSLNAARTSPTDTPSTDSIVFESLSMGLALLVAAWLFYRVGGGLFNPNVTFALLIVGAVKPLRSIMFMVVQFAAAIAASALLQALLPGALHVNTVPGNGTSKSQAVFIEMFITAALCFAVLRLTGDNHGSKYGHLNNNNIANTTDPKYNYPSTAHGDNYRNTGRNFHIDESYRKSTILVPIGLGMTFFVGNLWAAQYTGGSMNTARSFGPAVVSAPFNKAHWVYWVGPFAGSILAAAVYKGLQFLQPKHVDTTDNLGTTAGRA